MTDSDFEEAIRRLSADPEPAYCLFKKYDPKCEEMRNREESQTREELESIADKHPFGKAAWILAEMNQTRMY